MYPKSTTAECHQGRPLAGAFEENEPVFQKIFNHSNDAIFVIDPERDEILDVNPKACMMLGYSREELLFIPVSAVHPKEMPQLLAFASSVFEQGHGWTSELSCLTREGVALPAEISASVVEVASRRCLIAMVRDTSDRKRAELELRQLSENLERQVTERTAELRRSEERQRALLEVNHAVVTNLDRESLFEAVTRSLRKILYFDVAVICLRNRQRDAFKLFALERSSLPDSPFSVGEELDLRDTHIDWVLEHGKPLLRNDLAEGLRFDIEEKLMAKGIRSYVAVPLVTGKAALGTLNIGSKTPNRYSENEVSFLTDFAKQLALAVENMVAYEEIVQLKARLEDENIYLQEEIRTQHNFEEIIGQTTAIKKVLKAIETVAPTDAGVLILGETGTGKELIARAVHNLSRRKNRALIKVNCAAIPSGLVESELFGHEKGAFTGALAQKIGRFELADGGTILLDEIGELPVELQPKLLRVLQEGEFERVGGSRTLKVTARVIAATNRNLEEAVDRGTFREDLFYRLSVFPVSLPPLRERREDIALLVQYFTTKHGKRLGKKIEQISRRVLDALKNHPWPGNIRELENVIEHAVILSQGKQLGLDDALLQRSVRRQGKRILTLEETVRNHITEVLKLTGGRVSGENGAAKILNMKATTLESRMKKLKISKNRQEFPAFRDFHEMA